LGAVAAVAISYFFTPEQQVKVGEGAAAIVLTKWQIVKVIPLSLIVGSAGGAFLTAMQSRLLAQVNKQKAVAAEAAGQAGAAHMAVATKALARQAAELTAARVEAAVRTTIYDAAAATPPGWRSRMEAVLPDDSRSVRLDRLFPDVGEADSVDRVSELHDTVAQIVDDAANQASSAIDAQAETVKESISAASA
jgi:hypothetical protein